MCFRREFSVNMRRLKINIYKENLLIIFTSLPIDKTCCLGLKGNLKLIPLNTVIDLIYLFLDPKTPGMEAILLRLHSQVGLKSIFQV